MWDFSQDVHLYSITITECCILFKGVRPLLFPSLVKNGLVTLDFDQSFSPSKSGSFLVVFHSPFFDISSKNNIFQFVLSDLVSYEWHLSSNNDTNHAPPHPHQLVHFWSMSYIHTRESTRHTMWALLNLLVMELLSMLAHLSLNWRYILLWLFSFLFIYFIYHPMWKLHPYIWMSLLAPGTCHLYGVTLWYCEWFWKHYSKGFLHYSTSVFSFRYLLLSNWSSLIIALLILQ